jgi:hypothetical protein
VGRWSDPEKEATLDIAGSMGDSVLGKGERRFAFALVVPSPTSLYERTPYGRVYHRVNASGFFGTTLEDETDVRLMTNPAGYAACGSSSFTCLTSVTSSEGGEMA